jgi:hypothetical protein
MAGKSRVWRRIKAKVCPECGSPTDLTLMGLDWEVEICEECGWEEPLERYVLNGADPP